MHFMVMNVSRCFFMCLGVDTQYAFNCFHQPPPHHRKHSITASAIK